MRIVPDSTDFPTTDNLAVNHAGEVTIDAHHHLTDLCDANPLGYLFQAANDSLGWVWVSHATGGLGPLARTAGTREEALQALLDDWTCEYVRESDAADEWAAREADMRWSA